MGRPEELDRSTDPKRTEELVISRRVALKRMAAVGSALLASAVVVACGGNEDEEEDEGD